MFKMIQAGLVTAVCGLVLAAQLSAADYVITYDMADDEVARWEYIAAGLVYDEELATYAAADDFSADSAAIGAGRLARGLQADRMTSDGMLMLDDGSFVAVAEGDSVTAIVGDPVADDPSAIPTRKLPVELRFELVNVGRPDGVANRRVRPDLISVTLSDGRVILTPVPRKLRAK